MFHAEPIYFVEWIKIYLGEEKYELLKESHNQITKFTTEDLELKYKVLAEIKESLTPPQMTSSNPMDEMIKGGLNV